MGSRTAAFGRHGIRQRVVLVVLVGTTSFVAALGWTGWAALGDVREQLAAERTRLARAVAVDVGRLLDEELEALATLALDPDVVRPSVATERRLLDAYRRSRLLASIFLVPADGSPALVAPSASPSIDRAVIDLAHAVAASGRPTMTHVGAVDGAVLLVPVRSEQGAPLGAVGGTIVADQKAIATVLASSAPAPGGWIELRDAADAIVATGGSRGDADNPLSAEARIGELGWRVVVHQPMAEAFAGIHRIQRVALVVAPLAVGLAVLLAWGAGRSVVGPLGQLTRVAEAIAGGDLDCPVPTRGTDEAGRLARALDDMRRALKLRERDRIRGELLKKTIAVQEDERKRVARELHDETSQTVNALLMGLDAASAQYPSEFTRERLVDARRLARRLLDGVHRLILDLRPSMLDDLGLCSAIEWFASEHLEPLGVAVHFEVSGEDRRLPRETEIALFRVAQETITNIARHAHADSVLIQCAFDDDRFTLEIEDDGDGFDVGQIPADGSSVRGLGLAGMRERVTLVGGTIDIDSSPGDGTRVAIQVPVAVEVAVHA